MKFSNMNNIDKLIEGLNKEQKEAVLSTEGPNLIIAGAGTGKTVICNKVVKELTAHNKKILYVFLYHYVA